MEYLEGKTLKELLVSRGPTPVRVAIDYTRQILSALDFAHRHGIVHRDIKPHNVVVAPDGRLKVTDFGIARSGSSQMTEAGSIIGTAQYLSPEQAQGKPVHPSSDLYSVGVVLYEMLTGTVPFTGDTALEIAMKHLNTVPEPPSEKRPPGIGEVPHELDLVVLRALAKDSDDRYQTAREMDADLGRVAQGLPVAHETEEAATAVLVGRRPRGRDAGRAEPRRAEPGRACHRPTTAAPGRGGRCGRGCSQPCCSASRASRATSSTTKVDKRLSANATVQVPFVQGITEGLARDKITNAGLEPIVRGGPARRSRWGSSSTRTREGGNHANKGDQVVLTVVSRQAEGRGAGRQKGVGPGRRRGARRNAGSTRRSTRSRRARSREP